MNDVKKKKVFVLFAPGFEEIEAISCVDILRRCGLAVSSVSVGNDLMVEGSRKIIIKADVLIDQLREIPDAVVLPGGMPGAKNLSESSKVEELVKNCFAEGKIVAAICAAPAYALAKFGVLRNKKAACYPNANIEAKAADKNIEWVEQDVVVDANIITSRGPGTALYFALAIAEKLVGKEQADLVKNKALIK